MAPFICNVQEIDKSIETESRLWLVRAGGSWDGYGQIRSDC